MDIDIIGAGIGGLTTSIALKTKGIKTKIYEQTKEIKPVGAGIIMANNAMQVFEKLGLKQEIAEHGNPISSMNVTNSQLKPISGINLKYFEKKYHVQNIAIHRGRLQQILINHLDEDTINLNHELTNISKDDHHYQLTFTNGTTVNSQCVVGADGLNSTVRNFLFNKNKIRNSGQICWRGVTDFYLPQTFQNELNEAWGKGDRFGFVQIAPNKVYWYALKSFKHTPDEYSINELGTYFKSYHSIVSDLIKETPTTAIHTATISDLKPIKLWYKEGVCLLGDAAHATTPNMGQGACQAIEDAYILAECLQRYDVNKAFSEYQRRRIPKAHQVVNSSWNLGKLAHWKNPLAIKLRNQLMQMAPESVNRRRTENIFQLEYSKF